MNIPPQLSKCSTKALAATTSDFSAIWQQSISLSNW